MSPILSGNNVKTEVQPLCAICHARSDGMHYGVQSCASCKSFFRRTIKLEVAYSCEKSNDCSMEGENRMACRACRYRICLSVGMDKDALQKDRGKINRAKKPITNRRSILTLPALAYPVPDQTAGSKTPGAAACTRKLTEQFSVNVEFEAALLLRLATQKYEELAPTVATHFNDVLMYYWRRQLAMRKAIVQRIVTAASSATCFDDSGAFPGRKNVFIAASIKTMLVQMQAYIVAAIEVLKDSPCFGLIPHEDKMPLFRNYTPHIILLTNIMSTLPTPGEFLVLMDGMHIVGRNSTNHDTINNIMNEILDVLVPRFRELSVDDKEFTCLRNLVFWNSDVASTSPGRSTIHRVQYITLMVLRHYVERKCSNELAANLRYGNLLMLIRMVEDTGERLRACLQSMIASRLIDFDDLLLDLLRDPKMRQPTIAALPAPSVPEEMLNVDDIDASEEKPPEMVQLQLLSGSPPSAFCYQQLPSQQAGYQQQQLPSYQMQAFRPKLEEMDDYVPLIGETYGTAGNNTNISVKSGISHHDDLNSDGESRSSSNHSSEESFQLTEL